MNMESNTWLHSRWAGSLAALCLAMACANITPAQTLNECSQQSLIKPSIIASSRDLFVAINQKGGIVTSTDGVQWSTCQLNARTFMRGVACGQGLFVAVGGSYVDVPGVIMTSTDGITWIPKKSGTRKN